MKFIYSLIMTLVLHLNRKSSQTLLPADLSEIFKHKSHGEICRDILYDIQAKKIYTETKLLAKGGYSRKVYRNEDLNCDTKVLAEILIKQGYIVHVTIPYFIVNWK